MAVVSLTCLLHTYFTNLIIYACIAVVAAKQHQGLRVARLVATRRRLGDESHVEGRLGRSIRLVH